jgi:hypothetical protein
MFRPIRMDHTNCLQVAIKTLQFKKISENPYHNRVGTRHPHRHDRRLVLTVNDPVRLQSTRPPVNVVTGR